MNTNLDSLSIKHLTADLHEELEAVPFNQKMFRGEQTVAERKSYLASWKPIMKFLDPMVPEPMRRWEKIKDDLKASGLGHQEPSTHSYAYLHYMSGFDTDQNNGFNGHIYLNYMGFMFGGQIMKKRYPDTASLYEFDDIVLWRNYVREHYVDTDDEKFVYQVREGFRMHINISNDLGRLHNVG